jgi:hypothetical protein
MRLMEFDAMTNQAMTAEQAATLKRLAKARLRVSGISAEPTRAEADLRLTAKLKLLGESPHTL